MCRSLLNEARAVVEQDHWDDRKPEALAVGMALWLYLRARLVGLLNRAWAKLTSVDQRLVDLDSLCDGEPLNGWRYAGIQRVPLERIAGSVGKCSGFDKDFYPLPQHDRHRWLRTAVAQWMGMEEPPIEMIQIGSRYYAQAGQYQISVAKALRKTEVTAYVTNWDVGNGDTVESDPGIPADEKSREWKGLRLQADRGADHHLGVDRVA